jgi:hypothetical protein
MERDIEPKHPGGRPTKRTPEITEQICEGISYGLRDEEIAAMVGIDDSTLTCWKKIPEFSGAIKRAVAMRKLDRLKRIEKGEPGWQGTAWAMERQRSLAGRKCSFYMSTFSLIRTGSLG